MKKYPFKFLDSYNQNDTDIFFGRDEEIEALYEMVFQNPILLVYGASGTGKTSLIQCGLAGKFKSYDWLALTIRRGTNINASLEKALIDAGANELDDEDTLVKDPAKKLTGLLRLIKGVYLNSFKPIYLIFDQFEELYILGKKDEQEKFIEAVKEILKAQQPVKMIFSIREEYLAHLFEFEKEVPQLLRKKLRVEPMTLDKVTDVIRGINNFKLSNVRIKTDEIDAITQEIFDRLQGKKKTLTIQLPYLQVFLDKLYIETTKDESRQADALITMEVLNRIGDIGDVLRNFLEEQVKGISQKLSSDNGVVTSETIWKILSPFCTLEGTKEPISKKDLADRLPDIDKKLIDESVEAFVNGRILNYSENVNLYELAHDSLALRIAEKRSDEEISLLEVRRLIKSQVAIKDEFREAFTEKQLNFIEPNLNKIALTEDERAWIEESKKAIDKLKKEREKAEQKKRARRRMVRVSIFGCITIGLIIVGFLFWKSSEENRLLADVRPIDSLINSAESNRDRALYNADKDPTNAFQLDTAALLSLDSAHKLLVTLDNNTYLFNEPDKKDEYDRLNLKYHLTDSLIKAQSKTLLEKDYALYKKVKPENQGITDSLFMNVIFPDSTLDAVFRIWHAEDSIIKKIKSEDSLSAVVFPTDNIRAMAMYNNGTAGYWDFSGKYIKVQNKNDRITSIASIRYSVIKYKMLSALDNKTISEWNLNGTLRVSYKNSKIDGRVVSIAISPKRTKIFTASADGMGTIWAADVNNIRLDSSVEFNTLQVTIRCSAFSNDGSMIVTGSIGNTDNTVKIWDADNGKLIKILNVNSGGFTSVAFSAKDSFVYTGSMDGTFRQWRVPSKEKRESWNMKLSFDKLFSMGIIETLSDSIINKTANK